MTQVPPVRRRELVNLSKDGTTRLDGILAQICGAKENFATVYQVNAPGCSGQWSWEAVERIMTKDQSFNL